MNVVPTLRYDPSTGQTIHVMTNKNGGAYRGGGDDDDFNNNYHDHASLGVSYQNYQRDEGRIKSIIY
jgi:hypothetical protein